MRLDILSMSLWYWCMDYTRCVPVHTITKTFLELSDLITDYLCGILDKLSH